MNAYHRTLFELGHRFGGKPPDGIHSVRYTDGTVILNMTNVMLVIGEVVISPMEAVVVVNDKVTRIDHTTQLTMGAL